MEKTASQQFLFGVKDELPILVGVVPFGMIYGILALSAGLHPLDAQAMSAVVFAGSAQFMTTQLVKVATPTLVIIVTGFIINLRHALYSATLAPYVKHLPLRWKALLAYLLTDVADEVTLTIHTVSGALVRSWNFRTIIGYQEVVWDGRNQRGFRIANGTYYLKLVAKNKKRSLRKIIPIAKLEGY